MKTDISRNTHDITEVKNPDDFWVNFLIIFCTKLRQSDFQHTNCEKIAKIPFKILTENQ